MRDRLKAKLAENAVNKEEHMEKPPSQAPEDTVAPPTALCRVDQSSISTMAPGDIFLIDDLDGAASSSEPAFHAILACPLCGSQVLISVAQYFGFAPVICGARTCSGFFRIIDDGRFQYLPVN